MKEGEILEEYRKTVGVNSAKARALIKKLNYKEDPFLLQCIAQTYLDESLLDDNDEMRANLEKRKWRMAERYIIKAFSINSNCANIVYTMGKVRKAYGQFDIAIYCFEKIIKQGTTGSANNGCDLDRNFVKVLINDSKFELYRIHHDLEEYKLAHRYLTMYKKGLEKGNDTIFKPLAKFLLGDK